MKYTWTQFRTRLYELLQRLLRAPFPLDAHSRPRLIRLSRRGLWFRPRYLTEWFMALGLWEPYVRRTLRLSRGDTFIDVGAHIGYFSRYTAECVGREGLVLCAEPDPRSLRVLQRNMSGFEQVVVIPKACGRTQGVGHLLLSSDPELSRMADDNSEGVIIEITSLDNLAQEFLGSSDGKTRKCVLKIDVEGSALDVVEGGRRFIEAFHPEIIIEAFGDQESALRRTLPSYSFERLAESYYYLRPAEE